MKINEIIKERRNAQGLTQEQVADYLGVSTPAVNKWEKGSCYPDITILPALARLLRVDLNTLLSFKEDLSEQEIGKFTNDLVQIISDEGFDISFEKAMDKIHEYPTCNKLILTVAMVLEGSMFMFGIENKDYYQGYIDKLYEKVAGCNDIELRNQAISMLINKHLQQEEYEKAQEYIDKMPNITYDKKQLQGNLYAKSGELNKASEVFENKLISTTTEIFTILISMMEIALKEERNEDAKYFAEVVEKTTVLYDLWEYNSHVAYFQLYTSQKDPDNFIVTLRNMVNAMSKKWDSSKSRLYKHIKTKENEDGFVEQFRSNFINMLKNDKSDELDFVKDNEEFYKLLNDKIK